MTSLYHIKRYLSREILRYFRRRRRFERYGLSPYPHKPTCPQSARDTRDKRYIRLENGKHWKYTREMSVSFWPGENR